MVSTHSIIGLCLSDSTIMMLNSFKCLWKRRCLQVYPGLFLCHTGQSMEQEKSQKERKEMSTQLGMIMRASVLRSNPNRHNGLHSDRCWAECCALAWYDEDVCSERLWLFVHQGWLWLETQQSRQAPEYMKLHICVWKHLSVIQPLAL